MIGGKEFDHSLNRRTVLRCVLSGVSATLAGCGDLNGARQRSGGASPDSMNPSGGDGPEVLDEIIEDIGEVFNRLNQFPIVRGSKFVFEVRTFEDEFDYRELLDKVDSMKARLKDSELEDDSESQRADLVLLTELAENLIRQRIVVHQIIAAGITFEELFGMGEYERATETIRDGIALLNTLSGNREKINVQVTQGVTAITSIEDYDPESIEETQVVLGEILLWTAPAYRGLYETVQGLQGYERGNSDLNNEEFGSARSAYREAKRRFQSAEKGFNKAQGRGERLPQMAPFIDGVRCMLPAYQTSSDELRKSMEEFEAGNDSRARDIGREAIISTKRVAQRCL